MSDDFYDDYDPFFDDDEPDADQEDDEASEDEDDRRLFDSLELMHDPDEWDVEIGGSDSVEVGDASDSGFDGGFEGGFGG